MRRQTVSFVALVGLLWAFFQVGVIGQIFKAWDTELGSEGYVTVTHQFELEQIENACQIATWD